MRHLMLVSFLVSFPVVLIADGHELWRYRSEDDVSLVGSTWSGDLVIGTENGSLRLLDSDTGGVVWTKNYLGSLKQGDFKLLRSNEYGVLTDASYGQKHLILLNLETGEVKWDSRIHKSIKLNRYLGLKETDLLLLFGKTSESDRELLAIDMKTGETRWRQSQIIKHNPKEMDEPEVFDGTGPYLGEDGATATLYVSKDGPFMIDLSTGKLLWKAEALKGKDLESRQPWLRHNEVLYVPYEQNLAAIDANSGKVIWEHGAFESRLFSLRVSDYGLVVAGREFIDLVALETGQSKWPRPIAGLTNRTKFIVDHDAVFVATENSFISIDLEKGTKNDLGIFEFKGRGERPQYTMIRRGDDFILRSSQNLLRLDSSGHTKYHTYYPAGKHGLARRLFLTAFWNMFAMWQEAKLNSAAYEDDFFYILTSETPDDSASKGFNIVQVDIDTGKEVQRLWLEKLSKRASIFPKKGIVFVFDGREISAIQFDSTKTPGSKTDRETHFSY